MRDTTAPLLEAADARIAVDDVIAVERLTFAARGERVLIAGETEALFAALTGVPLAARTGKGSSDELPGEARVVAGSLLVAGQRVASGAHLAICGAAPLDPPLPPGWIVEDYVAWSARLAGVSASAARELAQAALVRVGLVAMRKRGVLSLGLPERRALQLASAVVTSPDVLLAEAPLSGLEGASADFVMTAVAGATEGRAAILSGTRLHPGAADGLLARGASHVIVLLAGRVALDGAPGELFSGARVYGLRVRSNVEPLRAELSARGIDLRGGPDRFAAALPEELSTRDILVAAKAAKAPLIELMPLI